MPKKICVLIAALLLIGCAHHTNSTVGGMFNNLETGFVFNHQYQIVTTYLDKQKKMVNSYSVFGADSNTVLPSNTASLDLLMTIVNPHKLQFEIWERVNYIDLETDRIFRKEERIRYKSIPNPNEFVSISIDLPIESDNHCRVVYFVFVKDSTGQTIYHTYTAQYKIKTN